MRLENNSGRFVVKSFSPVMSEFWDLLYWQLRAHAVIICLCLGAFTVAAGFSFHYGRPVGFSAMSYLKVIATVILPISLIVMILFMTLKFMLIDKPESPMRAMGAFLADMFLNKRRWARAIPAIFIVMFGFMAYADFKPLIPTVNPFAWDERFMQLDRLLHFGQDPWRLLAPVFGHADITQFINLVYNVWFLVMYFIWVSSGWSARERGWERQFLLSFVLCWIVAGSVLATLFSSMGPAFYDLAAAGVNPYAAQIESLKVMGETHSVSALSTQDILRESYLFPEAGKIAGISAMPSMHNATSTLFMLVAFRVNKWLGLAMCGFLSIIVIGSVHLAWHYAVDAYAGVCIALCLWYAAGKILAWQDRKLGLIT